MSVTDDKVKVKFLHQAGVQTFDRPMRNDLDTVFERRVFYGLTELHGTGPFHIPSLAEITKLFKHLRKQPRVFLRKTNSNYEQSNCITHFPRLKR